MLSMQVRLLSEEDLDSIHRSALEVLWEVGVQVDHPRVRALLDEYGCRVEEMVVRFPPDLMEEIVREMRTMQEPAPYAGMLPLRVEPEDAQPTKETVIPVATGQSILAQDLTTDEIRPATVVDLRDATRLVDLLPGTITAHPVYIPQDVPNAVRDIYALTTVAENYPESRFVETYSRASIPYFFEIDRVIRGSEDAVREDPPFSYWASATPPLHFGYPGLEIVLELQDRGLRTGYGVGGVMPLLGASSPVTLAGCLVSQTAETLACNVLNKVLLGRVTGYGAGPTALDMREMTPSNSSPEAVLLLLATMELERYYGNPTPIFTYVLASDAKLPDVQAGMEKALKCVLAVAAGCRVLSGGLGVLGASRLGSMAQMVIDYELCQVLNRLLRGISVTPDTLALETIKRAGIRGSFFSEEHTVRHMRNELFFSEVFDRTGAELGRAGSGMLDLARDRAKRLLREAPPPTYLTPEQVAEMEAIARRAQAELA